MYKEFNSEKGEGDKLVFGYARVSTRDQKIDRQIDALNKYGVDEIFEEKISGEKKNRPQLDALLNKLRSGDVVVVYELKRLGRNTKQLLHLVEDFNKKNIDFVSITEDINTTTSMGKFIFTTWCALAQLDRDIISENTKSGLEAAKARGRLGGRRPHPPEKVALAKKMYYSNEYSLKDIKIATGMSKQSLYDYLRKDERYKGKIIK